MNNHAMTLMRQLLPVLALAVAWSGWTARSDAQTIGGRVEEALGGLREESQELLAELQAGFEQARAAIDRMGVQARVYARLHWDKELHDAEIAVKIEEKGVAILSGAVASEQAKVKATGLARDTVGIQRVDNRMTVTAADTSTQP